MSGFSDKIEFQNCRFTLVLVLFKNEKRLKTPFRQGKKGLFALQLSLNCDANRPFLHGKTAFLRVFFLLRNVISLILKRM